MEITTFLLLTLAVYRLSYMVTLESGPFGLCEKWREWVAMKLVRPGYSFEANPHRWIFEGIACPLCVSFWFALSAFFFASSVLYGFLCWLGCAGLVLIIHKVVSR
jgi:hypothetical protein